MRSKTYEKFVSKSLSKAKYRHVEAAKRDLLNGLRVYKGLKPQLENFVFDDGDEKTLINLNGTIPVVYKGVTYNIPVCFWLKPDYPNSQPIGYVKPTSEMQIKQSISVDQNGRIFLPYLDEWKFPESNLLDMIQVCTVVFGQTPPVFSKAKATASVATATQRDSLETPSNPSSQSEEDLSATNTANNGSTPASTASSANKPSSSASVNATSTLISSSTAAASTSANSAGCAYSATSTTTETHLLRKSRSKNDFRVLERRKSSLVIDTEIADCQLKESLLSAAEEVLRDKLEEEWQRTQAEVQVLHQVNRDLLDGQERIHALIDDAEKRVTELDTYAEDLKVAGGHLTLELEKLNRRLSEDKSSLAVLADDHISEGVIRIPEPEHRQVAEAAATDMAIDDALFALAKAFSEGKMECDVYLKKVRNLSRKQFLQRAILDKKSRSVQNCGTGMSHRGQSVQNSSGTVTTASRFSLL